MLARKSLDTETFRHGLQRTLLGRGAHAQGRPCSSQHWPGGEASLLAQVNGDLSRQQGHGGGKELENAHRGLVHTWHCAKGSTHNISFNPHNSAEAGVSIPISQMRPAKLIEVK